ncbi:MAG TPA: hypothetical protein VND92_04295, partial [Vicinamibacterales bacterium]|nr:hypothetical protein [Vicinamibacterales bacterium]
HRIRIARVGQAVAGTLIEPIYAYDRVVFPAGTKVLGRISALRDTGKAARIRAIVGGDFTPTHTAVLQFDTLVPPDGRPQPVRTRVGPGTARLTFAVAGANHATGVVARARRLAADQLSTTLATIRQPGRFSRLVHAFVESLPYHPQYLEAGTVYVAELLQPIDLGVSAPTPLAPAGTALPPEGVLTAYLSTAIDSAASVRGTPVAAVLTQPLFSSTHQLIFPVGTTLHGEVTFSKPAARFHRNGQLRFLFESVERPAEASTAPLLAAPSAVATGQAAHVTLDEEGGAHVASSKTRFVAPALAFMVARAAGDNDRIRGSATGAYRPNVFGRALGGAIGWSLLGVGLSQLSRPLAAGLGWIGLARTLYGTVLGKGRDISFPAETLIQVHLSAGPQPVR